MSHDSVDHENVFYIDYEEYISKFVKDEKYKSKDKHKYVEPTSLVKKKMLNPLIMLYDLHYLLPKTVQIFTGSFTG